MDNFVATKGEEPPANFLARFPPAAGSENPTEISGSTTVVPVTAAEVVPVTAAEVAPVTPAILSPAVIGTAEKKKRGRPRKYGPDGKVRVTMALSPMPISASIPMNGDFPSGWKNGTDRPVESFKKKKQKPEVESPGSQVAYSVGADFTPHLLTVNTGEDVSMKIISFSQRGSRAICILSANGAVSNVTLRQPNSSGGTLTYEGRFEILALTGSFMLTDNGVAKTRSGGMSVTLAGPDGRVLGGGLAGLLIAAGPVQVVIGSFLPGHQQEQKPKKQKYESVSAAFNPIPVYPISLEESEGTPFQSYRVPKISFPEP
ncbi:hypothetical protein LguiB_029198 [Lonicera macranthoides]